MPSISVIVPVRNEAHSIERTLRALLTQDFPPSDYEVVVADGASTDETVPIVRRLQAEFRQLKLVFNAGRLSSCGRNTAVRHATKDVVVVVDGHCHIPGRDYLSNVSAALGSKGADSLGRPQPLDVPNATPFQRAVAIARSSRLGHNPGSDIYSSAPKFVVPQSTAVAYLRGVFQRVGLFDEAFDACEDVEFNERVHAAGLTCFFEPSARVAYEPRKNLRALFHQLARYGLGRARLAIKHPRSLSLPALVPPLWLMWLVAGGVMSLAAPFIGALWLTGIGLYLALLLSSAMLLGRGQTNGVRARIPAVVATIHFGFAWGFWKEMARQLLMRIQFKVVSPRAS
jgi:glycosyltransferase involved in cell wall biosynthesis